MTYEADPPKYLHLAQTVRRRIQDGTYPSGERIPGEHELAEEFSISRPTVVRALELLKRDGWLESRQGFGTIARGQADPAPSAKKPPCCTCGDEPATAVDQWTGDPIGEDCAGYGRIKTEPLTVDDIVRELQEAVTPDEPGDYREIQGDAMRRIAGLLIYQQQRIADLEAAVAELTNTAKENDA
jgi:DNA-binding transcriptional MocR family regulator